MYAVQHCPPHSQVVINNDAIEKIVILIAMPEEAEPIIAALQLIPCNLNFNPNLGLQTYQSKIHDKEIFCVVNGYDSRFGVAKVGTEAAVLATYETIRVLKPDTIINVGTAGGYRERGASIGDIYLGSGCFSYHDRRIPVNSDYDAYASGHYPCLEAPALANALNLKTGLISTGNSFALTQQDQETIKQNGSVAKEMEVAAIASVANLFGVRVLAIKVITNLIGLEVNPTTEFENNFQKATQQLAITLPKIISYLLDKTPKQLQMSLSIVAS